MARQAKQELKIKLLDDNAVMPYFATDGAACFDIVATSVKPHGNGRIYTTGLAFEIPDGYGLDVFSRSGHGFNYDLSLANSVGIIDPDYKGELMVKLKYAGPLSMAPDWPQVGDRIAQARLVKLVPTKLVQVDELSETDRGEGGLGSTGK